MNRLLRTFWAAPVVFALLLYLAFPNDVLNVELGFLAVPAWAVLLLSLRVRGGQRAFRQGFFAGVLFFVPALTWIAPLVGGGWLFTAAWCASFVGVYAWCLAKFWFRAGRTDWVVPAALLHVLFDLLRTVLLTGFPWFLTGYTGADNPVLIASADLFGVHTATLAILLLAAGLAEFVARRMERDGPPLRALVPGVVLVVVLSAWAGVRGFWIMPPDRGPVLALLQGNIPQFLKEDREATGQEQTPREVWWQTHVDLIAAGFAERGDIDVIVWPETMVPQLVHRDFEDERTVELFRVLSRMSRGRQTFAGVQTVALDEGGRRTAGWNSMVALDGEGRPRGVQDKQHRTPGGEYIPLLDVLPFRDGLRRVLMEKAGSSPTCRRATGSSSCPSSMRTARHAPGSSSVTSRSSRSCPGRWRTTARTSS